MLCRFCACRQFCYLLETVSGINVLRSGIAKRDNWENTRTCALEGGAFWFSTCHVCLFVAVFSVASPNKFFYRRVVQLFSSP